MRSHTSNAAQNSGGELPLLGLHQSSARTSGTSYGRAQIVGSWRAKCSSSRSLYYADGYEELEASSRHDVRRSASTLYRTDVDSEYFERLQLPARRSRLHANNNSRISRLSKQPATSCSTSSPQLTRDALTPLRVESARGRIAGWSLPISSTELPAAATRDQEISCPGSRNKQEEQQQQADEEDHDRETEEQQLEEEEEEEEAGKKKNYVWKKNVHEIVCQSCGMEVAVSEAFVNLESKQQQQLRRRRRSSRVATMGGGPDQRGDENSSLVEESESSLKFASCEDGIEDLQPRDDEKRSAAAPPSPASWKPAAGGSARAASQSLEEIYMTPATSCEQDRSAAVPFKWEDAPGKPKTTTTTTTQKAKARCRLSREQGFEFNSFVEEAEIVLSRSAATASATVLTTDQQGSGSSRQESGSCELKSTRSLRDQTRAAVGERSHRYYGDQVAAAAAVHRREKSLQEKETTTHIIDLVAPAAAKFLVQETSCYLSPVATPLHHRASFASPGAVPFKWEETPGKPKADAEEASSKPHSLLQLPPRLAIPQQQRASDIGSNSSSSFFSARDLCAHYLPNYSSLSGPLVGFFSPCLTSACNAQARPRQHAVHHSSFSPSSSSSSPSSSYKLGSKSLPRKLSPSSSPPPVNSPALRKRSAFSAPLASSSSPTGGLQPRICYSSEELLKAAAASYSSSHPCKNNVVGGEGGGRRRRRYAEAPSPHPAAGTVMMNSSSSTPSSSIFHDRPEAESLSQTSGSNPASSSGYFLDALTRPTSCCTPFGASSSSLHVRSKSSSSSSSSQASYESVEQEFDQEEEEEGGEHAAATRSPTSYSSSSRRHHRLHPPLDSRCSDQNSLGGGSSAAAAASAGMKALIIKLCRNGNCFNSCSSSEEARAPSTLLATYFHNCMELNQNSTLSGELDEDKRSSRSSAAVAAATATTAVASPIPLTRLPYTMPSVAEQELAARQLQHKPPPPPPNPDFAARLGGATTITKLIPPLQTAAKTCNPAAATMMSAQCEKTLQLRQLSCNNATHYSVNCCCFRDDEVSSASPAYAAALEMLSPAMNFMPQQSRCKSSTAAFVAASSSSARTRKTTSSTTCRWTGPKVRHRVRFIFSMCKALKRVLFKQRHRKVVVEPNFWYHDEIPLTEFQFVKPTEY